jgi:hypothetical protein
MKSHGLSLLVGTSFVTLTVLLAGCPFSEATKYLDGKPRQPGGDSSSAVGSSGSSGSSSSSSTGGTGGTGSGSGGAGGCTCDPMPCKIGQCGDTECEYTPDPLADGTQCPGDVTRVCADGDCLLALGQPCGSEADCASDECVNGVCCDGLCDGTCKACDLPDQPGTCGYVPVGTPHAQCTEDQGCIGNVCKDGGANGDSCLTPLDCLSNTCVALSCRLPIGEPCKDPVQCASNYCSDNHICDAPPMDSSCNSSKKANSTCRAAPGEPCGGGLDCASTSNCDFTSICKASNGTACTGHHQCSSNFCNIPEGSMMGSCSSCDGIPDACGSNACIAGKCPSAPFPEGTYCKDDIFCTKGLVCTGFPRKCTPKPMP